MRRAKEQIIRQRDFAIRLGVTTGYLRRMLKASIDFTERITSMIEAELGISAADWLKLQDGHDRYSGLSEDEMLTISARSLYSHYEGLPIEEVVHIELKRRGYTEEDLTEDQMERFKDEMRFQMEGWLMLDRVLAELSPDSEADIRRMVREWMAKRNNKDTSK